MAIRETTDQYVKRMLRNLNGAPLEVLAATPATLRRLIKGRSEKELTKRPPSGGWSVAEILAHLADTELVIAFRFRKIIAEPGSTIQAYDQDAWATNLEYSSRSPAESLNDFTAVRQMNLRLLQSLPQEQWQNYGNHAERGKETVEHIHKLIAGHDINHTKQIEKIIGQRS